MYLHIYIYICKYTYILTYQRIVTLIFCTFTVNKSELSKAAPTKIFGTLLMHTWHLLANRHHSGREVKQRKPLQMVSRPCSGTTLHQRRFYGGTRGTILLPTVRGLAPNEISVHVGRKFSDYMFILCQILHT